MPSVVFGLREHWKCGGVGSCEVLLREWPCLSRSHPRGSDALVAADQQRTDVSEAEQQASIGLPRKRRRGGGKQGGGCRVACRLRPIAASRASSRCRGSTLLRFQLAEQGQLRKHSCLLAETLPWGQVAPETKQAQVQKTSREVVVLGEAAVRIGW